MSRIVEFLRCSKILNFVTDAQNNVRTDEFIAYFRFCTGPPYSGTCNEVVSVKMALLKVETTKSSGTN